MIFAEDDMKTIYNTWRADVDTYMSEETLAAYGTVSRQQAHQLEKKSHGTVSVVWLQVAAASIPALAFGLRPYTDPNKQCCTACVAPPA